MNIKNLNAFMVFLLTVSRLYTFGIPIAKAYAAVQTQADVKRRLFDALKQHKSMETIEFLVEQILDVNATDENGASLLHIALLKKYTGVVSGLLERRANVNVVARNGWTPLHVACGFNRSDFVEALIAKGAFLENVNDAGQTALYLAIGGGHYGVMMVLLRHGANVNVQDDNGETPLHYAVKYAPFADWVDKVQIVKEFISRGANSQIKDKCGRSSEVDTSIPEIRALLRGEKK